ncbi:hypothetical protein L2E82_38983 [Cichorium intybus]|uniref:Uncharacterized protein n=1 Tax=Cichorium intybus TaxID=13427 RepID=A0ACB9AHY1_CICIN|nr:hypothetical protein L2E82_38983 [Cichorium intybus]
MSGGTYRIPYHIKEPANTLTLKSHGITHYRLFLHLILHPTSRSASTLPFTPSICSSRKPSHHRLLLQPVSSDHRLLLQPGHRSATRMHLHLLSPPIPPGLMHLFLIASDPSRSDASFSDHLLLRFRP